MNILKWIKSYREQWKVENDLVDRIIYSMTNTGEKWRIDQYEATCGDLVIWIYNYPYGDMTINGRRLPRRVELRRALALCASKGLLHKI